MASAHNFKVGSLREKSGGLWFRITQFDTRHSFKSYILFFQKKWPQPPTNHHPHFPSPTPKNEGRKMPPKKKPTTKLHGLLLGYPFQGDRLGRQQIRKALTTQARPGRTSRDGSRRVVKERRLGGTDTDFRRDGCFLVCWVEGFLKAKNSLKGWHEAWGILAWVSGGILIW